MNTRTYKPEHWLSFVLKPNTALQKECRVDIYKATGKGGQKKNKTSNAIRLTLAHLSVTFSASRSRAENLERALKKLRLAIALDICVDIESRVKPQDYPKQISTYYQSGVININSKNPDFPILIGKVIDEYITQQGHHKMVAESFGISNSQLNKFIQKHPFIIETINKIVQYYKEKEL